MKILVIGQGEQLENTVDFFSEINFGVVGKSLNHDDVSGITKTIIESLEKGYGLVVAYVNDGIGAGISLNRDKRIRAANCSTELDISLAKKNNVNVILLSTEAKLNVNILKPFAEINIINQNVVNNNYKKENQDKETLKNRNGKKVIKNQTEENNYEVINVNKNKDKKGFFKNIKDSLGIVDE
ncbi:MAG: RpiB/LacA/LacB family sugar-phosphate isomerase [Candidatus Micrarchaeaceae archaeon]